MRDKNRRKNKKNKNKHNKNQRRYKKNGKHAKFDFEYFISLNKEYEAQNIDYLQRNQIYNFYVLSFKSRERLRENNQHFVINEDLV